uniref:TTF-type domain-containing protein n=1 Tax=Ciona savignyi TaxID=51511 RepID=H2ZHP2_CIOSA
ISDDLNFWPQKISENLRNYWIQRGSSSCQHKNHGFKESVVQLEKESQRRYCSIALFQRVHARTGEQFDRTWLCYSKTSGRVYCFVCKLMSSTVSKLTSGLNNWKHAHEILMNHENSKQHLDAMAALCARKSSSQIDSDLVKQYEGEVQYWQELLRRLVSVVKLLCVRGLAFRGKNELIGSSNNGNYLGILELLSEVEAMRLIYLQLFVTCEELIELMGQKVLCVIIDEIKTAKYFSISVDSTPDIMHVDQLTVVIRYVLQSGPVERFLKFIPIYSHTGSEIARIILQFLEENGINIQNCRGQSYDNASNMSGKYKGVQAIIRERCSVAYYIPCTAHSLNLIGKCAAECCPNAVEFFNLLQNLYSWFVSSTHRWQNMSVLEELQSDENQPRDSRLVAEGFLKKLQQLEVAILVEVWDTVLERFQKTSLTLQGSKLPVNSAVHLLESLLEFVRSQRSEFEYYEERDSEVCCQSRQFDEGCSKETIFSPRERFRCEVYLPIMDALSSAVQHRLHSYMHIQNKFGFLSNICELSKDDIRHAAIQLMETYVNDFEDCFPSEMIHFSEFYKTVSGQEKKKSRNSSTEIEMLLLLDGNMCSHIFPNVHIALRIYLFMAPSNCCGERSFSKLKRIKNEARNSMGQERLNFLSLMSIENDVVDSLSFTDLIRDFALRKARK